MSRRRTGIPNWPANPTDVFDAYWQFAAERQRIFQARLSGAEPPFTEDPVLHNFKFTNAYRASDRTSQYLIRHVIYDAPRTWRQTFYRIILFKLFNLIGTWEYLEHRIGDELEDPVDAVGAIEQALNSARAEGKVIYSAAYIMPSATSFGSSRKHVNHLRLMSAMAQDKLELRIGEAESMRSDLLTSYPSIGRFLGYQLATDLNYSPHLSFDEDEFVVAGPGALDGIAKCFGDAPDRHPEDIIWWTYDTQQEHFRARGIDFPDLWGRPLQLIDCQNLYCEISKYARVAHPEVRGTSDRKRIKQRFEPTPDPLTAWYPPKWNINKTVESWLSAGRRAERESDVVVDLRETTGAQRHLFDTAEYADS